MDLRISDSLRNHLLQLDLLYCIHESNKKHNKCDLSGPATHIEKTTSRNVPKTRDWIVDQNFDLFVQVNLNVSSHLQQVIPPRGVRNEKLFLKGVKELYYGSYCSREYSFGASLTKF